jgi:hypothetical protein
MNMRNSMSDRKQSVPLHRRELLKLASSALLGLTAATPHFALPLELRSMAETPDWKPAFFNAHQNETLVILTELIIPKTDTPGANDAKVHRYLDLFMEAGNVIDKQQFLDGLAWLDEYSRQQHGRVFKDCSQEQQISMLKDMAGLGQAAVPDLGHGFFNQAKNMTSMIYYATSEGYQELNKFGPPPSTVGCEHVGGRNTSN